jgi:hypothetical protein
MDSVQNCDNYINILSSQTYRYVALTCWARSGDVICFLWGTDKPIELSWVLKEDRTMNNVQNFDSYITVPSSYTYRIYFKKKFISIYIDRKFTTLCTYPELV